MKYQVRNNQTEEVIAQFLCLENAKSFAEHVSRTQFPEERGACVDVLDESGKAVYQA